MKRIGLQVLLGFGAAVAVIIGVSAALNRSTGDPEPIVPVVPAGHVHGLGVNEADGSIMAASHGGLFRADSDGDPGLLDRRWSRLVGGVPRRRHRDTGWTVLKRGLRDGN